MIAHFRSDIRHGPFPAAVILAAILISCERASQDPAMKETPDSTTTVLAPSLPSGPREDLPPGVTAMVDLPAATVATGATVTIRFVLTNRGPDAQLGVVGSMKEPFDATITDSAGRKVWSRLHGIDIDLSRRVIPVRAGDSVVFVGKWHQRDTAGRAVAPGTYWVRGSLPPSKPGRSETAAVRLRVCPTEPGC